jgi:hypothetical protein
MAAATQVLLYNQRQYVVVYQSAGAIATRRFEMPYAKNLVLNKGVDNIIEFAFINQDQKPVNITGLEITFRILDYVAKTILLQKTIIPTYGYTGIGQLTVLASDIIPIDSQLCYYSIEIPQNNLGVPVFVDAQGGARGVIKIVDSVLPSFTASEVVTIPEPPSNYAPYMQQGGSGNVDQSGNTFTYYSSIINSVQTPVTTIQTQLNYFTGNIQIQGNTTGDETSIGWYNIGNAYTYTSANYNDYYNVVGFHPYLRLLISQSTGTGAPWNNGNGITPSPNTPQNYPGAYNPNNQFYDFYGPNGMGPYGNGRDAWVDNAPGNDYGGNSGGWAGAGLLGGSGVFPDSEEGTVALILVR